MFGTPSGNFGTNLDLHMPPSQLRDQLDMALGWWPSTGGRAAGEAQGSSGSPYFLASTSLSGGRLGVIVDTGAWTNLWGMNFAKRLSHRAVRRQLGPTEERLKQPLYVAGVGSGALRANWEIQTPIAATSRDGVATLHRVRAPAVEGDGVELPALLGLRSTRVNDGVVETDRG